MQTNFSKTFNKQYDKASRKIKSAFDKKLIIFLANPSHPQLKNHPLSGKYKGYRSINVTGDWRAIYSESKSSIIFELLGTHSQLYK